MAGKAKGKKTKSGKKKISSRSLGSVVGGKKKKTTKKKTKKKTY
jgi:hypothetical protein